MSTPIENGLHQIGLPDKMIRTFLWRRQHSHSRLEELTRRLRQSDAVRAYQNLVIYAAGSYARGEASPHSDIDLFFIHDDSGGERVEEPRLKGIRVMSSVIREIEEGMEFPPPSNDGQFLNIIELSNILEHLGSPEDDYKNHFTARMLLLLESAAVYGEESRANCIDKIIESYLRDYEDHAETFRPTFLVNDILRFWKTLCLNYEHRRNQTSEARKIKQKIRNFKLGYSRLLTCFATIALLSSYNNISRDELIPICNISPLERLLSLWERKPEIRESLYAALTLYHWFLEKTELSTEALEQFFGARENRVEAFGKAKAFGDEIFKIVTRTAKETGTLRYLVV